MVVGPGLIGAAPAHAGLFGIDFFGDEDKSDMHHPRPGSEVSAQSTRSTTGFAAAEAPTAKIGSAPENDIVPESTAMRSIASAPESIVTAQTVGGGGGGVPGVNTAGRADESAACVVCSRHPQRRHPQVASGGKLRTRVRAAFAAVALCGGVGGTAPGFR